MTHHLGTQPREWGYSSDHKVCDSSHGNKKRCFSYSVYASQEAKRSTSLYLSLDFFYCLERFPFLVVMY